MRAGRDITVVVGNGRPAAEASQTPVDLLVVAGPVHRVLDLDDTITTLYDHAERRFADLAPPPRARYPGLQLPGVPQPLSVEERAQRLVRWKSKRVAHTTAGKAHLLGTALAGLRLTVTSRGRFIAEPELRVTFHNCSAVKWLEKEDFDYEVLVEPVLGKTQDPWGIDQSFYRDFVPANYPVTWEAAGRSVTVTLTPDAFRPNTAWTSEDDDLCVVALDDCSQIRADWALTERGSDAMTTGSLVTPVERDVSTRDMVVSLLRSSESDN